MIRRRLCCSIFLLLVALASCILLTSASGVDDEFEDNYHVNHADLAAAVEAELAAASSSSSSQLPREFSIRAGHRSAQDALQEYRAWHARTMADPEACAKAEALVWSAQAGFGDSVNALTSSFRYALATGRLFFIVWRSSNDPAMWKRGLMEPGFEWDWNDALKTHPECGFRKNDIESVRASRADNKPPPRVVLIRGTIVADNPVAHATEGLYESDDTRMVMYGLGEGALQDFLLVPNAELQSLISSTASRLYDARPADYWATVGIQIRTGYADAPDAKKRPGNANFLAQGDEKLFVEKFLELWRAKAAGFPARTKVFLMTDSPVIAEKVRKDLSEKHGVEVVTVTEGEVAHCGPTQTITQTGVMRMLAEWFVFKLHTDVQIITAWSLFGGSAVEGRNGGQVYRIDASNCGKTSAKPCQNSY